MVEIVLILMTWQFVVFAKQAQATSSATWMLRIPAAPVWWAVALMLGISAQPKAKLPAVMTTNPVIKLRLARFRGSCGSISDDCDRT